MRITVIHTAIGLTLAATSLAACGSSTSSTDADSGYCTKLKGDKEYFQSLDSANPDLASFDKVLAELNGLSQAAPAEVSSDWKELDKAVVTIQDAMKDAGVDFADLAAMEGGKVPEGVDMAAVAELGPKLAELGGPEMNQAAANIEEHAKSECGVDLTRS